MTLTLLALFFVIVCLKIVLDPKSSYKLVKHVLHDETATMLSGIFALFFAMIIFMETGLELAFEWESLLAWVAVLSAIKGTVRLFFPEVGRKWLKRIKAEQLPVWGFLGLVFALFLVYVDTQILG